MTLSRPAPTPLRASLAELNLDREVLIQLCAYHIWPLGYLFTRWLNNNDLQEPQAPAPALKPTANVDLSSIARRYEQQAKQVLSQAQRRWELKEAVRCRPLHCTVIVTVCANQQSKQAAS